jgi:transposase
MKLYVGLDVGLEETNLCMVDSDGLTVREVTGGVTRRRSHAS